MNNDRNPLELRKRIKNISCGFDAHKMKYYDLTQVIKLFVMFYQGKSMINEDYKERFEALCDTVEQFGGSLRHHPDLINVEAAATAVENNRVNAYGYGDPNDDDMATATSYVTNKIKACFMLSGADNGRHQALKDYCENSYTMNEDKYPLDSRSSWAS